MLFRIFEELCGKAAAKCCVESILTPERKGRAMRGRLFFRERRTAKRDCGECTRYSAQAFIMHTTDLQRDVLVFYSASCRASVRPNQPATRAALVSSRAIQSCHNIIEACVVSVLCWGTIAEISPLFFTVSIDSAERDSTRCGTSCEHSSDAPLTFCTQSFFLHNFRYLR